MAMSAVKPEEQDLLSQHDADTDTLIQQLQEEEEELACTCLLNKTLWQDVCDSVYESRFVSLFVVFIALYFSYYITIAPYQSKRPQLTPDQLAMRSLKYVRPVLEDDDIARIRSNTMYAETLFVLPDPFYDTVKLRFHPHVSNDGNFQLPEIFYQGVIFGLTWTNSHDIDYFRLGASADDLEKSLRSMEPRPTNIFKRHSQNNVTNWNEQGFAVHFSNDDLRRQGWISSDKSQPWKRTLDPVLLVAHDFKLAYIFQWYPHRFGEPDISAPHKHEIIIQQVIPTRTGIESIKSSVSVWLSATNSSEPKIPPRIIRKAWTSDDHWSLYSNNNT